MILQTQNTEDQPDFQMTLVTQHLHCKHKERGTDIGTEIFVFFFISRKHCEHFYHINKLHTFWRWELCCAIPHHRKTIGNKNAMIYLYYLLKDLTKQNLSVLPCLYDSNLMLSILKPCKSKGKISLFAFLPVLRVQVFLIHHSGILHNYQENIVLQCFCIKKNMQGLCFSR